jgi:hypothetical protein
VNIQALFGTIQGADVALLKPALDLLVRIASAILKEPGNVKLRSIKRRGAAFQKIEVPCIAQEILNPVCMYVCMYVYIHGWARYTDSNGWARYTDDRGARYTDRGARYTDRGARYTDVLYAAPGRVAHLFSRGSEVLGLEIQTQKLSCTDLCQTKRPHAISIAQCLILEHKKGFKY